MSQLIFVAVPDANTRQHPRLGVVVVPKHLASLEEAGMADWPAVIGRAALVVEVQAPSGEVRAIRHSVLEAGRSDVWTASLAGTAIAPPKPPTIYPPPTVRATSDDAARVLDSFAASADALSAPGPEADTAVEDALTPWDEDEPVPPLPPVEGRIEHRERAALDFHGAIAFLREHPTVLRALGLVLRIDLAAGPDVPEAERLPRSVREHPHLIRMTWPDAPVAASIGSPWTAYEFDGERFVPQAAGDLRDGLVDLSGAAHTRPLSDRRDGRWEIATLDVDGGSARLRDAARAVTTRRNRIAERNPQDDQHGFTVDAPRPRPQPVSLPTLRSAGMALLRRGRAEQLGNRTRAAAANAARAAVEGGPPLTAEDLVLGYRVDIKEQGADSWLSLCRREGGYTVAGIDVTPDDGVEEGHVKAHAATIDDTRERVDGVPELLADEVVCRWSGWSLAVPRPVMDRSLRRGSRRRSRSLPFDFDWRFAPPAGSLPTLGFGRDYRMRIRVADIAGGGLGPANTDNDGASDLVGYGRYEPVPPPRLVPPEGLVDAAGNVDPDLLGPGGTVDRLVVRSDPNALPLHGGVAAPPYPLNSHRDLLPPATSFEIAEQHGTLRAANSETWERAARAMNLTRDGIPGVETSESIVALPDPAAAGVAAYLHNIDDADGVGELAEDAWDQGPADDAKAVRLAVGAPSTRPRVDWTNDGTATVTLPPAGEATLELSSYVIRDRLSDFAIKTWLPSAGEDLAVTGRHTMVTPPRTLRLVHAVRRPLRQATGLERWLRGQGDTSVRLAIEADKPLLDLDPASTAQLDITGTWVDVIDDPTQPAATEKPGAALVRSIVVGRTAIGLPEMGHDLGDTKHRVISYTASATGRFREFFADSEPPSAFIVESELGVLDVPSSARPDPPTVLGVVPSFAWEGLDVPPGWSDEIGSTLRRVRRGGRVRIEVARPWFSSGRDEMLAVLVRGDTLADGPPEEVRAHLSEVGRDPIYDAVGILMDGDPIAAERWLHPQFVTDTEAMGAVASLAELGPGRAGVVAKPYAVRYEGGRCFADVVITGIPEQTYCPLARFAVARYQGNSLEGLSLSNVVRLDPVPLLPDRTLTIERVPEGLRVTLAGRGPASGFGRTNRVDAMVERLNAPAGTDPADIALTDLGGAAGAVASWGRLAGHAVTGGLDTPLPVLPLPTAEGPLRLYVREVERFYTGDAAVVIEPAPGGELSERVVFADTVPLG